MSRYRLFFGYNSAGPVYLTLRPNADAIDGNWVNKDGNNTDLYASIYEVTADDDTTYIRSGNNPSADVCKIALDDAASAVITPMRIKYRYRKQGSGTINLQVRLLQGTTELWSATHNGIIDAYVTADTSITPNPEITDPTDLFLEFSATAA